MRIWGFAIVIAACGGSSDAPAGDAPPDSPVVVGDPPDADDRSGTRLKRRLLQTADGTGEQLGWFDSLLDFNCTFRTLLDGSSRCVPFSADVLEMFTDASCTTPVFRITAPVPTGYFETGGQCAPRWWRDAQVVAEPAMLFSNADGNNCFQSGLTGGNFFTATEAQTSEFVGATISLEPNGSELMSRVRTTDDGGREFLHLFAPAHDADCEARLTSDGAFRCAPRNTDSGSSSPPTFSDDGCSQLVRAFAGIGGACVSPVPAYRIESVSPAMCGPSQLHFAPMTPYTGALFEQINQTCEPEIPSVGLAYAAVGARIDPASFVAESSRASSEAGRVRRYYSVYTDGSIGRRGLFDTTHGVECDFDDDVEGVERCDPAEYLDLSPGFADAACTQRLADSSGDSCPAEIRPAWARASNGVFFRVTGEYTGATAFVNEGNGCEPVPLDLLDLPLFTVESTPVNDWEPGTIVIEL